MKKNKGNLSLGNKIKTLRKELGITQNELSDGIVTRNMLSQIENGEAMPSLSTLSFFASRLNVSTGYLLDESDDGSMIKNQGLIFLAKKEFNDGNYESCLNYLELLSDFDEIKKEYAAKAQYLLGVKKAFSNSSIKQAQTCISSSLKNEEFLDSKSRNDAKILRALLDGFSYSNEAGKEEEVFSKIRDYADFSSDLTVLSGVMSLLLKNNIDSASEMLSVSVFENNAYSELLNGSIAVKKHEYDYAKTLLTKSLSSKLPSVIHCYCLTMLEKACAESSDFERAYAYMNMRKELVTKLLKKT